MSIVYNVGISDESLNFFFDRSMLFVLISKHKEKGNIRVNITFLNNPDGLYVTQALEELKCGRS